MKLLITFLVLSSIQMDVIASENDSEKLRERFSSWISSIQSNLPFKSSPHVKREIIDKWPSQSEDYQLISLQSASEFFLKGHIENAQLFSINDFLDDEKREAIDSMLNTVLYSNNSMKASSASVLLGLLDYSVYSIKFGMMDWNTDAHTGEVWTGIQPYPVSTKKRNISGQYSLPVVPAHMGDNTFESLVKFRFKEYVLGKKLLIKRSAVKAIIDNWDINKNHYQVLSVRSQKDYIQGHIPHAINIPLANLMDKQSLRQLDPDKKIIVYCYTGHLAQLSTTLLRMLGYDAYNLEYGMMGWNKNFISPGVIWDQKADFPVIKSDTCPATIRC